jgi:hypothetical protein
MASSPRVMEKLVIPIYLKTMVWATNDGHVACFRRRYF